MYVLLVTRFTESSGDCNAWMDEKSTVA